MTELRPAYLLTFTGVKQEGEYLYAHFKKGDFDTTKMLDQPLLEKFKFGAQLPENKANNQQILKARRAMKKAEGKTGMTLDVVGW